MVLHTEVARIAADARDDQRVVSGIVVRKATFELRHSRGIQLPAYAEIHGKLWRDHPLVLNEGEDLPGAVSGEIDRQVTADLIGQVQQEAAEGVSEAGLCAGNRGLVDVEDIESARAEGLGLKQIVAKAAYIHAPFEGVIAKDLGPGIH